VIAAGFGRPARQSRAAARNHRTVILLIGLGFLRSRLVAEAAIAGAVGLVALAGLARENQARTRARLGDWDRRQTLRHQRPVKAA